MDKYSLQVDLSSYEVLEMFERSNIYRYSIDGIEAILDSLNDISKETNAPIVLDISMVCITFSEYTLEEMISKFKHVYKNICKDYADMYDEEGLVNIFLSNMRKEYTIKELGNEKYLVY